MYCRRESRSQKQSVDFIAPTPKQDTHYVTFEQVYLSVEKAIMIFRSIVSISGSYFSPAEVLGTISERCDFQHIPTPPQPFINTNPVCSVIKCLLSCINQGLLESRTYNNRSQIPGCARPSKSLQKLHFTKIPNIFWCGNTGR